MGGRGSGAVRSRASYLPSFCTPPPSISLVSLRAPSEILVKIPADPPPSPSFFHPLPSDRSLLLLAWRSQTELEGRWNIQGPVCARIFARSEERETSLCSLLEAVQRTSPRIDRGIVVSRNSVLLQRRCYTWLGLLQENCRVTVRKAGIN